MPCRCRAGPWNQHGLRSLKPYLRTSTCRGIAIHPPKVDRCPLASRKDSSAYLTATSLPYVCGSSRRRHRSGRAQSLAETTSHSRRPNMPRAPRQGRELIAHELTHVVQQRERPEGSPRVAPTPRQIVSLLVSLPGASLGRSCNRRLRWYARNVQHRNATPGSARSRKTWSAALRSKPAKDPADPHAHTLADLPEGTIVGVHGKVHGWYRVTANVKGKEVEGYVSHDSSTSCGGT